MTGADIRNAALTAAFIAAGEGVSISMRHLRRAARALRWSNAHARRAAMTT